MSRLWQQKSVENEMKVWLSVTLAIKINVHNCKCDIKKAALRKVLDKEESKKGVFQRIDTEIPRQCCVAYTLYKYGIVCQPV